MEGKRKRGIGYYPGSRIRPQEADPNYVGTLGSFSTAATFISDASETFSSASYTDISGMSNKSINIEAGKTYGVILNGSLNTNSGGDTIWGIGINFSNGTQVIDVSNIRTSHTDSKSWESFTLMNTFTASSDLTDYRVQLKRNVGTGVASIGSGREWGVYIFEITNEFINTYTATSTGTWSDTNWHDVPGASTTAITLTSGQSYAALMTLKHHASSGASTVNIRSDFNSGAQTIAGHAGFSADGNEVDHYLEQFTANAAHTVTKLQVAKTVGAGTYEVIDTMQLDQALIPLDTNTQRIEFTQSGNQDVTSATYIDLSGVTDTAVTLEAGQNYVAIIACSCSGATSGGGDIRFGMNFNNGTEIIDAGFIEIQATESRQLESAMHVIPFTPTGNHTTLRLQGKRIAGTVTPRLIGSQKYQILIRKIN